MTQARITFSAEEIEILKREAAAARARWRTAGIFPRRVYEEMRLEFVTEYMRGAEPASSEKQQRWMRKIKTELTKLGADRRAPAQRPQRQNAGSVKTGASRRGAARSKE